MEQANSLPLCVDLVRAKNRWQHLRESSICQISKLEREGILVASIADSLKAAFNQADDSLNRTTFGLAGRD